MRGRLVTGACVLGVAVVIAGGAFAAIPSSDGTIHGCYRKTTRVLRVINAETGQRCTTEERPLTWSQTGPTGAAGSSGPQGLQGSPGPTGPPGTGAVAEVAAASESDVVSVGNTDWTDLPGATVTLDVPEGSQAMFVARFSSATTCIPNNGVTCYLQVLVDGNEATPDFDGNSVFMTGGATAPGPYAIASGYMERSYGPVGSGSHTVKVQYRNVSGSSYIFYGWNLTVERLVE